MRRPSSLCLALLLAGGSAHPAEPVVRVGEERVPDPHRWLEDEDADLVRAWWRSRDADARSWVAEEGHLAAVTAWLEAHRAVTAARPELVDHRDGVSLWRVTELADPPIDARGAEVWVHRLYVQGPGELAPGDPVDDRFAQAPCAAQLAPGGATALIGRLADPDADDPEAEEGEQPPCTLRLFDRATRSSKELFVGRDVRVAWGPDGSSVMVAHAVRGKGVLTEVARDGTTTERLVSRRAVDWLWWLPDGRLLGQSARDGWGRARGDLRLLVGPPASVEWIAPRVTARSAASLVGVHGDEVLLRTDHRANGFEVVRIHPDEPRPERWRSLVAERPGMDLVWARRHEGSVLSVWSRDGLQHLEQQPLDGGAAQVVDLGLATEVRVWRTLEPVAVVEARGPRSHRFWARASDGTLTELAGSWERPELHLVAVEAAAAAGGTVPVTLVHRAAVGPGEPGWDPATPVWMRVYGGFGHGQSLGLDASAELWLAAGGVLAVAHVRGGRERGEAWHEGASLANLGATFDDVVSTGRWLVDRGWTSSGRIAVSGTSAGGLTAAAAVARAPELFGAVWGHAGVYDLLRGPELGAWWPEEYGVLADPAQAALLRAESPVHRSVTRLPPVLLSTGVEDPVVAPAHSFKLEAAWEKAEGGPVLLRVDPFGSHGGGPTEEATAPVAADRYQATAHTLAFLLRALGMAVPEPPAAAPPPVAAPEG